VLASQPAPLLAVYSTSITTNGLEADPIPAAAPGPSWAPRQPAWLAGALWLTPCKAVPRPPPRPDPNRPARRRATIPYLPRGRARTKRPSDVGSVPSTAIPPGGPPRGRSTETAGPRRPGPFALGQSHRFRRPALVTRPDTVPPPGRGPTGERPPWALTGGPESRARTRLPSTAVAESPPPAGAADRPLAGSPDLGGAAAADGRPATASARRSHAAFCFPSSPVLSVELPALESRPSDTDYLWGQQKKIKRLLPNCP